jgi:hypothetical protein
LYRCKEEEVSVKGESQMFYSTMLQENSVAYVGKPEGGECGMKAFTDAVGLCTLESSWPITHSL